MEREELAHYIRENDPFFEDADLTHYSYYELMIIKVSIDVEKFQRSKSVQESPSRNGELQNGH